MFIESVCDYSGYKLNAKLNIKRSISNIIFSVDQKFFIYKDILIFKLEIKFHSRNIKRKFNILI